MKLRAEVMTSMKQKCYLHFLLLWKRIVRNGLYFILTSSDIKYVETIKDSPFVAIAIIHANYYIADVKINV